MGANPDPLHRYRTKKRREHLDRLEKARRRWVAVRKTERKLDAEEPEPAEVVHKTRYRKINFRMPVMPEDSKPSWAAEMHGERRLWCKRYDTCLSYAACLKWPGFDCTACTVREESPPTTRALEGLQLGQQDEIREVWAAIRRRN
jgi:hypothetical protein